MSAPEIGLPAFAVTSIEGDPTSSVLPQGGEVLWNDTPHLRVWGEWPQHKLHTVTAGLSRVAIFGDCFADDNRIQAVAERAASERRPDLLSELPGSHAAVVVEPMRGQVSVVSGLAGLPAIYYGEHAGRSVIASRPSLLGGMPLTPNLRYLTAQLAMPNPENVLLEGSTSYKGVGKLLGGQMLHATTHGLAVDTYEAFAPNPDKTLEEAAEELREALKYAVSSRIRSGLVATADLSGGMDSSSVAFLATGALDGVPLDVFTAYDPDIDEGDMSYVRLFTNGNPDMRLHTYVSSETADVFSYKDLAQTPWDEDFDFARLATPDVWKFMKGYFKFVGENGGGPLHLTGDAGDEIVGVYDTYLADLIHARQFGRFFREGMSSARLNNASAMKLWASMVRLGLAHPSKVLSKTALDISSGALRDSQWIEESLPWRPITQGLTWLTDDARHDLSMMYAEAAERFALPEGIDIGDYIAISGMHAAGKAAGMQNNYVGLIEPHISPQYPFLDNDVIRAAFSLPTHKKGNPTEYKLILQKALAGVVPPEVLKRRTKGYYDESSARSFRRSGAAFRELVHDSELVKQGVVDQGRILRDIDRLGVASMDTFWALGLYGTAEGWLRSRRISAAPMVGRASAGSIVVSTQVPSKRSQHDRSSTLADQSIRTPIGVPSYIGARSSEDGSLALFDQRKTKFHLLTSTQSTFLRSLAKTGNAETTLNQLQEAYPDIDPGVMRADLVQFITEVTQLGIVRLGKKSPLRELPTAPAVPDFVSTEVAMARGSVEAAATIGSRVLSAGTLVVGGVILGRLAPSLRVPTLRLIQKIWANRDATYVEGQQYLKAAQSLPYLGQLACLKASYTAALTAAVRRRRVEYHRGVSFDPVSFHDWVAAEGKPIRTELDGQVVGSFQSYYR